MRTRALYLALLVCISLHAQEKKYMTGLLPDDGTYETLPRKAELLTRDYTVLPSKHLLIQYCPDVKYQDAYGTCTSWATVYAARTIAEAVKNAWTDKNIINEEAFAPMFVYALTKDRKKYPNDNDCQRGTHIFNALQLMKDKGVVKLNRFNVLCANYVSQDLMDLAGEYKIDEYFTLFGKTISDVDLKVRRVKKSLSEDCPVIIAMWLPDSFFEILLISKSRP